MSRPCQCAIGSFFAGQQDDSLLSQHEPKAKRFPSDEVIVFTAKEIVTLTTMQPKAKAVAIKGDRIFAVGELDSIVKGLQASKQAYEINTDFEDKVLLPGFIEPHCHPSMLGLFWQWPYVGAFERLGPDGKHQGGFKTKQAVIEALKDYAETSQANPILAWGFDPVMMPEFECLTAADLDQVSQDKPVVIINTSGHIAYVNNKALQSAGYENNHAEGVMRDAKGKLTGELQELAAMEPILEKSFQFDDTLLEQSMWRTGYLAQRVGCTTIADLATGIVPGSWKAMKTVTAEDEFPVRLSAYALHFVMNKLGGVEVFKQAQQQNNDKLMLSGIKFVTDGSIQGYTANMSWPYYHDKAENGLRNIAKSQLHQELEVFHTAGIQCAIHTNGNAAIQEAIDCLADLQNQYPNLDIRHRLEHCQTVNDTQLEKMSRYHIHANFFPNHIYYWGDFHANHTLGPDRIQSMNPANAAKHHGIKFAFHSDAQVTPLDPLFTVWCAAKRQSSSGKIYGQSQCITVLEALKAVTIDAAYLLKQEQDKGSIEVGKLADFAVLEKNPLEVALDDIPSIKVHGTVVGGQVFVS